MALYKWFGVLFFVVLFLPGVSRAQSNFSASELDTLVSTIALYPDPLLVHVLTASTYGNQIPGANAFAQAHKNQKGEVLAEAIEQANLNYEPSVQALIPFPTVLEVLAKYPTWTDQLGDAVSAQKDEVLDAVQRMRHKAYDYGHLKTNDQVTVTVDTTIVVQPTRTEYVYVPVYNPRVVYYVRSDGYVTHIHYGSGVWLGTWYGEWGWGSCWFDWGPRVIYVRNYRWYPHRPIPRHPRRYVPPPRPGVGPAPRVRPAAPNAPRYSPNPPPAARKSSAPVAPAAAPARRVAPASAVSTAPAPSRRMDSQQPSPALQRTSSESYRSTQPGAAYRTSENAGANATPAPAPSSRMQNTRSQSVAPHSAPAPRTSPAPAPRSERSSRSERESRGGSRSGR